MIWNDNQCPNIGGSHLGVTGTLEQCKDACVSKIGCTAINYSPDYGCALRECGQPVPEPKWLLRWKGMGHIYNGYFLAEGGTITSYR